MSRLVVVVFAAFIALGGTFSAPSAQAAGATCCLCQIGELPRNQQAWFKIGCDLWLNRQKGCATGGRAEITRSGSLKLAESCRGGTLRLGYVGHWGDSFESGEFLDDVVIPTARDFGASVEWDNTACQAMENPDYVQRYLNGASLVPGTYVRVKGNQTDSLGLWEKLVPGRSDFYAYADSRSRSPELPTCKEFETKGCTGSVQGGQSGECRDGTVRRELQCCRPLRAYLTPRELRELDREADGMHAALLGYSWRSPDHCQPETLYSNR